VATQSDGKIIGHATAGWALDPAAAEFRSLKPNRAYLEALAKRTGGQVLTLDGLRDFVRQLPQRHAPVMESWSKPLVAGTGRLPLFALAALSPSGASGAGRAAVNFFSSCFSCRTFFHSGGKDCRELRSLEI
jgi:hypothetical protein